MKYGFIGCGNMGGAIAKALSKHTTDFLICDRSGKAKNIAQELGCQYADCKTVASQSDCLFLAVKPQGMEGVLAELSPILKGKKPILISMAAGLTISQIGRMAGGDYPIIRIMPNTPVAVGKGMTLYCHNELVAESMMADFLQDLQFAGRFDQIPESLFDAAGTVSGCAPAYMYMFIEAMADGAVACGVPRTQAVQYAAAAMTGAAEMVLATGTHPGQLKDEVCSPGGSTIAGVKALEDHGFRGAVMECMIAATRRNAELGK